MVCKEVQNELLSAMQHGRLAPEVSSHIVSCSGCDELWKSLVATSSLLDEWKAPESSPFWETRFRARLEELKRQQESAPRGAFGWLRVRLAGHGARPMLAGALAVVLAVGAGIFTLENSRSNAPQITAMQKAPRGTAVDDLQKLEKKQDMYADFDLLDDMTNNDQSQQQQPADSPNSL